MPRSLWRFTMHKLNTEAVSAFLDTRLPGNLLLGSLLCGWLWTAPPSQAAELAELPAAVASFGATVSGGRLYVYGGHVGKTHQHSIDNLDHHFHRLDLTRQGAAWEDLGSVPGLQGLPMVAVHGLVCRVGGLMARNQQGDDEDLLSIADVTCFEPTAGTWMDLPPLSQPRSSHDAVVVGDKIVVVGGWQLRGAGTEPLWHSTAEVLDLGAESPAWQTFPQPFQRRALAVAAAEGKVYALGGLGDDGTSRRVDIFDPATGHWSPGPELPEMSGRLKGFGVSAFGVGDRIYLSGADGVVHALSPGESAWSKNLAKLRQPRFFHRLLRHRESLLFLGGASDKGHLDSIETLDLNGLDRNLAPEPAETIVPADPVADAAISWPGFRGHGDGRAEFGDLPLSWSETRNVPWRIPLPGYGQSAPVVWGSQVFVTSVEGPEKETLLLSSFDLATGEVLWRRRFEASQRIENSEMVSRGAPTPAVDGERIYGFWESGDLVALDHQGETLWHRSLTREYGAFEGNHGIASSPVLVGGTVVVQATHQGPSYFLAVDKESGKNRWKTDRPARISWTTPTAVESAQGPRVISSGGGSIEALDGRTGEVLWTFDGVEKNNIPSAIVDGDLVLVASSDPGNNFALRRGGSGHLDHRQIAWRSDGVTSGFGSPVIQGDCVLFTNKAGVVTCVDRRNGESLWQHRLAGPCWASPIAADDKVFFFSQKGKTTVLKTRSDGAEMVAENELATAGTVYGVAAAPGAFLIRTGTELIRVGTPPPSDPQPESLAAVVSR